MYIQMRMHAVIETDYPSLASLAQPQPPSPGPSPQPPSLGGSVSCGSLIKRKWGSARGGSPSFRGVNLVKAQRWAFRLRRVAKTLKSALDTVHGMTPTFLKEMWSA